MKILSCLLFVSLASVSISTQINTFQDCRNNQSISTPYTDFVKNGFNDEEIILSQAPDQLNKDNLTSLIEKLKNKQDIN